MVSDSVAGIPPLHPQELVRATEKNGKRSFGYKHSQLASSSNAGSSPHRSNPIRARNFHFGRVNKSSRIKPHASLRLKPHFQK